GVNYYPAVVYVDGRIFKVNDAQGPAVGVSPDGRFVFLGRTLYLVSGKDPQSGNPRLRMIGNLMIKDKPILDTRKPLVLTTPIKDYHTYFLGGNITINHLESNAVPVELINDSDALSGKIGNLLYRGLVENIPAMQQDYAFYKRIEILSQDFIPTSSDKERYGQLADVYPKSNTIIYKVAHELYWKGYLWDSSVTSGFGIRVPLSVPADAYANLTLSGSLLIVQSSLYADQEGTNAFWSSTVLDIGRAGLGYAGYSLGKYLIQQATTYIVNDWGITYPVRQTVKEALLWTILNKYNLLSPSAGKLVLGEASLIVGVGLILDSAYSLVVGTVSPPKTQLVYFTFPIIEDSQTGKKYTAVFMVLPQSEFANAQMWQDIAWKASTYLTTTTPLGPAVPEFAGVILRPFGATQDEYQRLLATGVTPSTNLIDLSRMVSQKYNIPLSRLRITEVDIVAGVRTVGKAGFFQSLPVIGSPPTVFNAIVAYGNSIKVTGVTSEFKTDDPQTIINRLSTISINGITTKLTLVNNKATASFSFPDGVDNLRIQLPSGYTATADLNLSVIIKKDLTSVGDFGYNLSMHFDWDVLLRLSRIEFVDMPYPMNYSEGIFNVGNDWLPPYSIAQYFKLESKVPDNSSPTGWRYNYVSTNTHIFTPGDGGILERCKRINVDYYYKAPPDVSISILLNGTNIVSTLARHASL
ncbi:MAG: hypothetical protein ACP5IT_12100, partial [Thermoproteota archaeon]